MLSNLEEGGLDSGHGERDWLNVVGGQSVAPGDQQYSITFYRKISQLHSIAKYRLLQAHTWRIQHPEH